jgi:hypothetical protein
MEDEFGNLVPDDREPAWVPAEEREPTQAEVKTELLRSMLLGPVDLAAIPPPEYLIEGYFTRNSLIALYGRPGTAKSFIAISMALAIVSGSDWFEHRVHRGPVLYVAGEGTSGLAQRQRAWQEMCGIDDLTGMLWLPYAVNLLQPDWSLGLAELAADIEPELVVVDTLARSMVGGDENRSGDMAQAVEAADVIRRKSGATSMLVHHTPKDGATLRGHSALEGAVDTALLLERSEATFTLTAAKQKDLAQVDPIIFELEPRSGSCVPVLKRCHGTIQGLVGHELTLRDLIGTTCGTDGLPPSRLLELGDTPRRSFFRALKNLQDRGVIRNVGTSSRPRYCLVEEESEPDGANGAKQCHGTGANGAATGGSLEPRGMALTISALDLDEEI